MYEMIKPIKIEKLQECLNILKQGYEHTAVTFGMTEENCPYRGRTCLPYQVFEDEFKNGYLMYGYICNDEIVGFLSLLVEEEVMNINDIVILPEYQNSGIGSQLMQFAIEKADDLKCSRITLGMVYDNLSLRNWYEKKGFQTIKVIKFQTVNYTVGTMELILVD